MKYLLIGIGYLILWIIFIPFILVERIIKLLIILFQIIWHFRIDKEWIKIMETYVFWVPILIPLAFFSTFRINSLKDYFLLNNWQFYFAKDKEQSDRIKNIFHLR